MRWLAPLRTGPSTAFALVRLAVAAIILLHLGVGVENLPIPKAVVAAAHRSMSPQMVTLEVVCAILILIGLLTRFAAIPPAVTSFMVIISAKLPKMTTQDILHYGDNNSQLGLWSILTDVRAEFLILFGCVLLIYEGAGRLSMDWSIVEKAEDRAEARRTIRTVRTTRNSA